MACFRPLKVHYAPGAGGVSFSGRGIPTEIPCGQCIGCRREHARQWAVRCMHEASMWETSCFVTLTYRDENLPHPPSLLKDDHQKFFKRLRKSLAPRRISFFLCGEYGEKEFRPHYHAIIFGWWPEDAVPWKKNERGEQLYVSAILELLWGKGFCSFGAVTFESAAYVAGYVLKKVTGKPAEHYYTWLDPVTGELVPIEPERAFMSRRPAIGRRWLSRFGESDAYRHDRVVSRGFESPLPRYYDKVLAKLKPVLSGEVKKKRRIERQRRGMKDETSARRLVRETVELARSNLRKRDVT